MNRKQTLLGLYQNAGYIAVLVWILVLCLKLFGDLVYPE